MGIPGRKPNPGKGREKKGNPADVPLPDEPFADETAPDISCPKWLDRYGKEFWNEYVPRLSAEGVFRTVDRPAFEVMAQTHSEFRTLTAYLKKNGRTFTTEKGYVMQRPEYSMATKAKEQLRLLYSEFGMTASSRTRIAMKGSGDGSGEDWSDTGLDK